MAKLKEGSTVVKGSGESEIATVDDLNDVTVDYNSIVNALGFTPLDKSGDTMSGNLTVNGDVVSNHTVTPSIFFDSSSYFLYRSGSHLRLGVPNDGNVYLYLDDNGGGSGGSEMSIHPDRAGWGFIGTPNFRFFHMNASNMHSSNFHTTSTREAKFDIKDVDEEDIVKKFRNINFKKFKFKEENERLKQRKKTKSNLSSEADKPTENLGAIAEEVPEEISPNKKEINLNSYITMIGISLKALYKKVDELEEKMK